MSRFLIDDLALRWIDTALFGASIAGYVYVLVAQHGRWTRTVNHLLHQVMSVAMIAMVWPVGINLPAVGLMDFFLLAAVWFVLVAGRVSCGAPDRLTNGYNAVMMAAMAWMYAVMNDSPPGQTGHSPDHNLSAPQISWTTAEPGWITTVNWFAAVGFAVAAVYWLYRYFADRRTNPVPHTARLANLQPLSQAFMAAGIAIMFA